MSKKYLIVLHTMLPIAKEQMRATLETDPLLYKLIDISAKTGIAQGRHYISVVLHEESWKVINEEVSIDTCIWPSRENIRISMS
jgi:ubiquitin C-terminal hydrolase